MDYISYVRAYTVWNMNVATLLALFWLVEKAEITCDCQTLSMEDYDGYYELW